MQLFFSDFHKQFVVIESEDIYASGGNQRVRSLLRPLGLEDRCICHEHISVVIEREIDWQSIDKRLDVIRKDSECFLNEVFLSNDYDFCSNSFV